MTVQLVLWSICHEGETELARLLDFDSVRRGAFVATQAHRHTVTHALCDGSLRRVISNSQLMTFFYRGGRGFVASCGNVVPFPVLQNDVHQPALVVLLPKSLESRACPRLSVSRWRRQ
jgi:hypothetical protein